MFAVYHSNQLDVLVAIVTHLIEQEPLQEVFGRETILVQNPGMAQWLQLQFAASFRVAANFDFVFPANLIRSVAEQRFGDLSQQTQFSKQRLVWHILELLPQFQAKYDFSTLQHYLTTQGTPDKQYQLAAQLAALFDNYLLYRPEWLKAWENPTAQQKMSATELWQAELWRQLVKKIRQPDATVLHRAQLYQQLITDLNTENSQDLTLPKRIFICGISTLPPVYLNFLAALSQHCDVHLMLLNPCQTYWGESSTPRWLGKQIQQRYRAVPDLTRPVPEKNPSMQQILEDAVQNHPLLAAWGKLGRDYWQLLQEIPNAQHIEAFVEGDRGSLLNKIQQDILLLEDHSLLLSRTRPYPAHLLDPDDHSLTLHSCHSELREVEVLQDYLLDLLQQDPELELRDIVVMVADIERYSPYISAVFNQPDSPRYLPFSLSDRKLSQADPILECFLTLLDLPQSRCQLTDIVALLEVSALAEHFGMTDEIRHTLYRWIDESGIRWALDDAHLAELGLPSIGQNTWRFGLQRMLLGYALQSEQGVFDEILPYDAVAGLAVEWVGYLADFIEKLIEWRQLLAEPKLASEWRTIGEQLLLQFFSSSSEHTTTLLFITQQWQALLERIESTGCSQLISHGMLRNELLLEFSQPSQYAPFLAGKINFCTLIPMRSIPFKVICLLGMNEASYPRATKRLSFDLLVASPRKGDRNQRDDDYYLFLEALLAAQQRLYISYIGQTIQDNSPCLASVIVRELLDYIEQSFCLEPCTSTEQNILAIRQQLLIEHTRMPFHPSNFDVANPSQSYASEWLPVAQRSGAHIAPFIAEPLRHESIKMLDLEELQRFYRHPIRWFFQEKLGVHFNPIESVAVTEEPFALENLTRYKLNLAILAECLKPSVPQSQKLFEQIKGSGLLPYAELGELIYQQQYQEMASLAEKVKSYQLAETKTIEVDLIIQGIRLTGWLKESHPSGLVRYKPSRLTIQDGIALWIEHLVHCASGLSSESLCLGRDTTQFAFAALSVAEAQHYLSILLEGYQAAGTQPLYLVAHAGWEWLNVLWDKTTAALSSDPAKVAEAELKLLKQFQPNHFGVTLLDDPYFRRLLFKPTPEVLQQIQHNAVHFLLPLLRYRIKK